jgi:D-alanyl-D-alanine carboxypeptidase
MHRVVVLLSSFAMLAIGLGCAPELDRQPEDYACEWSFGDASEAHPRHAELTALVQRHVAAGFPGMVLAVRDADGLWVGADGSADLALGVESRPCQIHHIGSISKTFMAATTLALVDRGALSLDDPASRWLPASFTDDVANADVATVRQLLDHTSGIANYNDSIDFLTDIFDAPYEEISGYDYLDYVRGRPAYFEPGESQHYSNTNYVLLGRVIDEVAGRHHTEVMRELVFDPLGLEHTFYDWDDPNPRGVARGYSELQGDGRLYDTTDWFRGQVLTVPSGGVVSSVMDLQIFADALLRDRTLLSNAALTEMQRWVDVPMVPDELPRQSRYGLGVFAAETARGIAIGHGGDLMGYTSFLWWFPEQDVTVTALLNAGGDSPHFMELSKDVFGELTEIPSP